MQDYLTLGPVPAEEVCAQVGRADYYEQSRKECRVYVNQLKREFFELMNVDRIQFTIKEFQHDFGGYHEVCATFDDSDVLAVKAAYEIESDCPGTWDDEAKQELAQ